MTDEIFVDTNILVYAFDESEKPKRKKAKNIVKEITIGKIKGIVSNQILGELFVVLTKKIEKPVPQNQAQIIINGIIDSQNWKKITYTPNTISKAIETSIKEKTHFWDTVITETMLENKIYTLLTENTKDFKNKKIEAINPFKQNPMTKEQYLKGLKNAKEIL